MDASISRPRLRDRVGDTRVIRLLVVSQAMFNVGFYMVVPYLALHLTGDLGLSAAVVGVVLGLRTFSQQGLFVVGGWLADRFGTKWVVVAGCGIRVGGLVGLAYAEQVAPVLLAAVATGFAAALFSPAVEAELARERASSRPRVAPRAPARSRSSGSAARSAHWPVPSWVRCCFWSASRAPAWWLRPCSWS